MKIDGKKIMLILATITLVSVGSVAGYISYNKSKDEVKLTTYTLEESIMVNLKGPDSKILKMNLTLEHFDNKKATAISTETSRIKDAITNISSDKKADDIDSSIEKENLKKELIKSINDSFGEELVTDILFSEFIIN